MCIVQFVTLERAVPWRVQAEFNPGEPCQPQAAAAVLALRPSSRRLTPLASRPPAHLLRLPAAELILWQAPLHDVGFEGFTMQFKHTKYLGHHKVWARRLVCCCTGRPC